MAASDWRGGLEGWRTTAEGTRALEAGVASDCATLHLDQHGIGHAPTLSSGSSTLRTSGSSPEIIGQSVLCAFQCRTEDSGLLRQIRTYGVDQNVEKFEVLVKIWPISHNFPAPALPRKQDMPRPVGEAHTHHHLRFATSNRADPKVPRCTKMLVQDVVRSRLMRSTCLLTGGHRSATERLPDDVGKPGV